MSRASDHAYQLIRAEIVSGALGPGTPLREEQLAEICGVSRTPVREALRRLEAENFVRQTPGRRSHVADWSWESVQAAFELRALLESHAAARAAERMGDGGLRELRDANAEIAVAISRDRPDVPRFLDANRRFHATIMETAGSEPLKRAVSGVVEQPVVLRTAMQYDGAELVRSHAEHEELIAAFERRDSAWAAAVMTAHLRRAAHAYASAYQRARTELAA